jgi:signal transduction histidine kinase/ActR/RegA family two-component response regulator
VTRLGWLDRLLLVTLLPAFAVVLGLHLREAGRTGLLHAPVFAVGGMFGEPPRVGGVRFEQGGSYGSLRVGDRLLRVGPYDLRGVGNIGFDAYAIAAAGDSAETEVTIEREGQRLTLPFRLVSAQQPFYRVPFLVGIVLVAVIVLLRARGSPDARLFFSALMTLAIFETPFHGGHPAQTYLSKGVFHLLGPVAIALLVASASRLPAEVPPPRRASSRWAWIGVLFILVRIPYFYGAPFPTPWIPGLVLLTDAFFLLVGIGLVTWNTVHADPVGRRRVKWAVWGAAIGLVPITLVMALHAFFPSPAAYGRAFQYAGVCAVFYPLGLLMAVRQNLFDIDRLLSSTATYGLVVGGGVGLGLVLSAPLARQLAERTGLPVETATLFSVAVMAAAALPAAARLRPRIEAWLLPERGEIERGLRRLSSDLSDCQRRDELLELIQDRVEVLLRPRHSVLWIERGATLEPRGAPAPPLLAAGDLVRALESEPSPRDRRALRRLWATLPDSEREALTRYPGELLLPIRSGRRLVAVLLLAGKRSGDPYLAMELTLLATVAEKASGELARLRNAALAESERERAEEARALMERADAANRAKSRFLAAASHDLRQPLHALGLFIERLASRSEGDELVARVKHSVEALSAQFDALLDLSRLDAGGVVPRVVPFALGPELARLAAEHAEAAHGKGLALRFDPVDAWVASDPAQLLRIIQNLLSNAIRHTQHGEVHLRTRPRGDALAIEVADTGPGIPTEKQRAIFGEFVQLDGPAQSEGLGLGLSIVERSAVLLGHPLELDSRMGEGSVFRVIVPLAPPDEATALPTAARLGRFPGRSVWLVEDDPAVQEAMAGLLESWGCRVAVLASAAEARALLGAAGPEPALVIADYSLGGSETGLDVVRLVRERAGTEVPAVIVSGESELGSREAIRRSGLPFLGKPVPPAQLRALLAHLLEQAR